MRQMLHQHDIRDVLVVLIDTEGFDWQVKAAANLRVAV